LQNVENLIKSKAESGSQDMTDALRDRAVGAGWPADVVSNLAVEFDGANIKFQFPSHLADTVYDLEYGKPGTPPTSVMRGLSYRINGFLDEMIDDELLDTMVMSEEILHG